MNQTQLKELIASHHKPELGKRDGMVYQIWEDGEITLQKSGELLWQRNLHCIESGYIKPFPISMMPVEYGKSHGYAFVENHDIALLIRDAMETCIRD